jgi:GDP-L-fucose synthase
MKDTWEVDIWGTGSPIREWLYAKDFAKVIVKVIRDSSLQNILTQPVSIAQNNGISMKELANIINVNFGDKMNLKYLTDMPDGASKKVMANENFREYFGAFEFTDFNVGIKNTIQYYKSQYPY